MGNAGIDSKFITFEVSWFRREISDERRGREQIR
jgi:hypothetical protein